MYVGVPATGRAGDDGGRGLDPDPGRPPGAALFARTVDLHDALRRREAARGGHFLHEHLDVGVPGVKAVTVAFELLDAGGLRLGSPAGDVRAQPGSTPKRAGQARHAD